MAIPFLQGLLAVGAGSVVGLVLGLVGGGGSILAVPALVYLVGVPSPHVAIGTSAVAVGLNAGFGLLAHMRLGTVRWRCALVFAAAGILGASLGAAAGKAVDGQRLLAIFGLVMMVVALSMLRRPEASGAPDVRLTRVTAARLLPRLIGFGFGVGLLSGFFGIGGGFLIVPGLMMATGMPLVNAIGTSLVALTGFGLTTSASYAMSGLVDWRLALLLLSGGAFGSMLGATLGKRLSVHKTLLARIFAGLIMVIGISVFVRGMSRLFG